ncbi:D,D-heptose 1,7-bisphosphate phosphatase [Lysobacteraceae bacterium NML75-0749]|nr:D,D-heptose 1,7-bisphosphate phosphatase [Xanthomonadaceae bacterium NML75-0749]PJK04883.1 D,D-heptose 1,7-bisphosphate phosphatase [Xanthomonadaceae bacterium NML91-0268]
MSSTVVRAPYIDPAASAILAAAATPRRALFLDRDGVINVDHGYVHRPEQTDWLPGIFERCRQAKNDGMLLIVVTNQAGIGRGYYSEQQFLEYTDWMHREFSRQGAPLLATYYCPHHPEAGIGEYLTTCQCRKPAPGMLQAAMHDWNIDPSLSLMMGDKDSDMQASHAVKLGDFRKINGNL